MATNFLEQATYSTLAKPGKHHDGDGLFLDVRSASSASWLFVFTYGGKRDEVGLGSRKKVTLDQAREARAWCIAELAAGRNPRLTRKDQKDALVAAVNAPKALSVHELAKANVHLIAKKAKSEKHRAAWVRSLSADYIGPIANMAPADVKLHHVIPMLERHYAERPEVAKDIRQRLARLLAWAMRREEGWSNPCAWRDNLEHDIDAREEREPKHHESLPYAKVGAFVAKVRAYDKAPLATRLALLWGIASATRIGETVGCDWSEFDWNNDGWTVPGERMKKGRVHRVPLTAFHHAILDQLLGDKATPKSGPVFSLDGKRPVDDSTVRGLLNDLRDGGETLHGFRTTFRTWGGEVTGAQWDTLEACLSHLVGDPTERAYWRSDAMEKRRTLMEAWAAYLDVVQEDSNVVDIRRRRRAA